jgi:hypothetical protein
MTRPSTLRHGLLALLLSFSACAKPEASAGPQASVAAPLPTSPPRAEAVAATATAGAYATDQTRTDAAKLVAARPHATDGRKIVRTGELSVRVDDYEPARARIDALLKTTGGFVASAQVGHADGRVTQATLVLRVPSEGFEDLVAQLGALGTVIAEAANAEDVTDQWVDVSARLANAKKLEGRLIELVATQAGNVTQLLEVERELARVREQIELFEGRLHVLDDQVSLSTLTLHVETRVTYQAAIAPSFGSDAGRVLRSSWATISGLARDLALALVGFLPWLPLIGAAIFALRRYRARPVERA